MKWFAGTVLVAVVLVVALYRERTTERSIDIAAPPDAVWRTLTDFAAYPQWNPMVRSIAGAAEVGGHLDVTVHNNGSDMTFRPRVLAVQPGRELRWMGRFLLPRIVDGEHYFRIEPIGGGVRFTQGETFRGVLVRLAGRSIDVADSFDAANAALRDRVLATIAR